ncbi:hypothetical protein QQ054_26435 [Oscillatoria amoena NRMC-F 0135]|nr:MAG: hypothetical protein F9K23_06990 [Bacteroidota bacterium]MDL5049560.1 hypothetical protein [Oscillatoria amoena NRMC-F 0135]
MKHNSIPRLLKHSFAYSISSLDNYTEQNVVPLVTKSLFGSRTAELFPVQTGIKSAEVINIMDDQVYFQSGTGCGFTASGDTTFTQRTITVGKIKVNKKWCPDELESKWTQFLLNAGSYYETLVPEEALADFMTAIIAQEMEKAYWRGDTTSGNPNLNKFDGFVKIIDAAGTAVAGNTSAQTSITVANAVAIHNNILTALPASLLDKDDVVILEGWDTFRKLILGLQDENNFFYDAAGPDNHIAGELRLPGTNIRVVAVHGLNDTNRIFAGRSSNFFIGTDLLNDFENFNIWYSKDNDEVRMKARWKAGVQVAFPNEIVQYTNA